MKVFVTVGTTKFEKLVKEASQEDLLDVLCTLGYTSIQFQVGSGLYDEQKHPKIKVSYHAYFEDFAKEIESSDLIISHAGAGTCLEVLKKRKPLIVVINEDLMDNHQIELAQHLAKSGYLKCCTPKTLKDVLLENKFGEFKVYPEPQLKLFSRYLDKCMGFSRDWQ